MNVQYLQYFVELAKTGSYTAAAKALYVTQPSLTYGIKSLEQETGCNLVEPSKRGIALTEFGKSYLAYAQSAITALDKGQETIDALKHEMSHINIAATGPMSVTHVPGLISRFAKSEQGRAIDFNLQFTTASQGNAMVADGRVDVGFSGKESVTRYRGLRYYPLAYDRLHIVVPANHVLALRKTVGLADLLSYPYIGWSEETGLHDILVEAFERECGEQPKPKIKAGDSFQVAGLVAAGFGVAVCPETPYMSYLNVKKIDPNGEKWTRPFGLIYRKESRQMPAVRDFISFVEHHIDQPTFVYAHPRWTVAG